MSELVARLIEREAVLLHRIEVLQAEVRAWRQAWHARHDSMPDTRLLEARERAMRATDDAWALHDLEATKASTPPVH